MVQMQGSLHSCQGWVMQTSQDRQDWEDRREGARLTDRQKDIPQSSRALGG